MKDFRYLRRNKTTRWHSRPLAPRRRRLIPVAWLAAPFLAALLIPLAVVPLHRGQPAPVAVPAVTALRRRRRRLRRKRRSRTSLSICRTADK